MQIVKERASNDSVSTSISRRRCDAFKLCNGIDLLISEKSSHHSGLESNLDFCHLNQMGACRYNDKYSLHQQFCNNLISPLSFNLHTQKITIETMANYMCTEKNQCIELAINRS